MLEVEFLKRPKRSVVHHLNNQKEQPSDCFCPASPSSPPRIHSSSKPHQLTLKAQIASVVLADPATQPFFRPWVPSCCWFKSSAVRHSGGFTRITQNQPQNCHENSCLISGSRAAGLWINLRAKTVILLIRVGGAVERRCKTHLIQHCGNAVITTIQE